MLFLQITALLEGACKGDLNQVISVLEMLFDGHSVSDELVVGSKGAVRTLSIINVPKDAYSRILVPFCGAPQSR